MSTTEIRQKLFDYIRVADDKKVKAMYTIIENELTLEDNVWSDTFIEEMNKRVTDLENGSAAGVSWEEILRKASALSKAEK